MLLKRWVLAVVFLLLFTLSYRLSFLLYHEHVLINYTLWEQVYALFWGIRFDVAVAMPMALVSLIVSQFLGLFKPSHTYAFMLPWLLFIFVVHTADTLYFQDSGRHIGHEILSASGDAYGLIQHALHTGFSLIIVNTLLAIAGVFLWLKVAAYLQVQAVGHQSKKDYLIGLVLVIITLIGVRGGVTGIPQAPIHVHHIGDPNLAIIAANPVYIAASVVALQKKGLQPINMPASTLTKAQLMAALYPEKLEHIKQDSPQKPNIIFIFLESWNAAFMQSYNPKEKHHVTPNFDAFRAQSISSDLTLAGGHRTAEGLFASMCSFQNPLGASLVQTQLVDFSYQCLPEILNQQGYATSFIQGSYRDTGNVGSFSQKLGFEESLGKVELPQGKLAHNAWGLHDDDLYDIVLDKALAQKEPFFFAVNTTSTHDTLLPEHVKPLLNAKGHENMHKNVMHYADAAFGRFLKRFYASALASNTILVAVADHTAQVHGSDLYEYMIPMAIQTPNLMSRHIPFATSHRDIAPTLLELLHLPKAPSFVGKSLLSSEVFFADYYHNQHLGWIEGDILTRINLSNEREKCYAWREDMLLKGSIPCEEKLKQRALGMTNLMQKSLFSGSTRQFFGAPKH